MALTCLLTLLINLNFIQGITKIEKILLPTVNHTSNNIYANALSKAHYNPWACNYAFEPGYKCLTCSEALHCFPGNFALLVQCSGFLPFCRNGYCSRFRTVGCNEEYTFVEGTHGPVRMTTEAIAETTTSKKENMYSVLFAEENNANTNATEEQIASNIDAVETDNQTVHSA